MYLPTRKKRITLNMDKTQGTNTPKNVDRCPTLAPFPPPRPVRIYGLLELRSSLYRSKGDLSSGLWFECWIPTPTPVPWPGWCIDWELLPTGISAILKLPSLFCGLSSWAAVVAAGVGPNCVRKYCATVIYNATSVNNEAVCLGLPMDPWYRVTDTVRAIFLISWFGSLGCDL